MSLDLNNMCIRTEYIQFQSSLIYIQPPPSSLLTNYERMTIFPIQLLLVLFPNHKSMRLDRWLGIGDKSLEIGLVPGTSLWRWLVCISLSAERIVSGSSGVRSSISLSSWLDPDESIEVGVTGGGCWEDTETGTLNVAPISPG